MCDRSPAAPGASHPGATRPVERTLRLVSGRWRLLIPFHLGSRGPTRQGALRRSLAPVTPRVLTRALRDLEADEPVWRRTEPTVPPVVTYGLTGRGHALAPVFEAMAAWGSDRSIPARLFGQVGVMVLMNRDAWDGLTDEQRAAIEEAATTLETQSVARFDELAAAEFEALKGLGMAETRFSDAEAERLEELWAEGVWSVASGAGDAAKALRETARGAGLTR